MKTKLHCHGCCWPAEKDKGEDLLDVGLDGMEIFMHWYNSCLSHDYCPDLNALAVFIDYLEDKVEPSEKRDEALVWYKNRLSCG